MTSTANLHVESTGSGEPVLFIHAGVADSRMWDRQFQELSGHRLIRFDLRGYGHSPLGAEPFSNASDAFAVLDSLEIDRAVLVGCSIGGNAALKMCQMAPERVRGLVLIGANAPGFDPGIDYQSPEWPEVVAAFDRGDLERVVNLEGEIWLAGIERSLSDLDQAAVDLFLDMDLTALGNEEQREELEIAEPLDAIPDIAAPVLVMVGDRDLPQLRAAAEHLADHFEDARLVVIEDSAHLPSMDQSAKFNTLVSDFLTSL